MTAPVIPDTPEAPVRLIKTRSGRGYCYQWEVLQCPFCGKKHWHGAGDDPSDPILGYRVSHCSGRDLHAGSISGDYRLVRID